MRQCKLCRFPADLPKERPRFCVIHWNKIPTLQPAGPRNQPPRLRVVRS